MPMAPQSGHKFPEIVPPREFTGETGGTQRTSPAERVDPSKPAPISASSNRPIATGR
jgi:hypothetical protein